MSRYGRDPEEIDLELAYCYGEGIDPIERFDALTRVRRHEHV